jgi:cytosine/adenosine deaminase-related metal-dependent hydrolase
VRLHTHLAEDPGENDFCIEMFGMRPVDYFDHVGWGSSRSWIAHGVQPDADECVRLGAWGTGVAHCPSSNMILGAGLAPVRDLRAAGAPVGLGVDGSASADSASMWTEARNALLVARLRDGQRGDTGYTTARDVLEIATRGSAGCLGRDGELGQLTVGATGDIAVWKLDGLSFAGAVSDPVEAWLRCGPLAAHHTVIAGELLVEGGELLAPGVDEKLRDHRRIAEAMQGPGA